MGLKEEIVGKLTRNSERVSHGHEILTGEEKRKKLTGEVRFFPFYHFIICRTNIQIIRMNRVHSKTQVETVRRTEKKSQRVHKTDHRILRLIRERANKATVVRYM